MPSLSRQESRKRVINIAFIAGRILIALQNEHMLGTINHFTKLRLRPRINSPIMDVGRCLTLLREQTVLTKHGHEAKIVHQAPPN